MEKEVLQLFRIRPGLVAGHRGNGRQFYLLSLHADQAISSTVSRKRSVPSQWLTLNFIFRAAGYIFAAFRHGKPNIFSRPKIIRHVVRPCQYIVPGYFRAFQPASKGTRPAACSEYSLEIGQE